MAIQLSVLKQIVSRILCCVHYVKQLYWLLLLPILLIGTVVLLVNEFPTGKLEFLSILLKVLNILENGDYSDFALVVGDKEFKVHKAILGTRSSVFKAMLSADLEEKKHNRVEITDIDAEVFEQLLAYIYSGTVPKMNEYALDLFVAADKYQLEELKTLIGESLTSSISIETVANILLHADMHTAAELKSKCIKFITANSIQVMATDGWKQLLKTNRMQLMWELFADIAQTNSKS